MVSNAKTPVMVLQELAVKRFRGSPEYNVIHARQGTHENEFHYRVMFEDITAIGIGPSKQIAKHDAAQKALDKLAILGVYIPGETVIKPPATRPGTESFTNGSTSMAFNSIGTLSDLCVDNKISLPTYHEISEVGPPHCKEFTYRCQIASIVTKATAGTKKHAKQLAAKDMLERIKNVLPEVAAECTNNVAAIFETDEKAAAIYCRLEKHKMPKPNLSIKVKDYVTNIKSIIKEKELDINTLKLYFREPKTLPTFKKFLNDMELECFIEQIQEDPIMIILKVNLDTPFTVLATGNSYEDGVQNVIVKSFEYMDILLS